MDKKSEYFISHIINNSFANNTVVEKWPMHLTVVPPFLKPESINNETILEIVQNTGKNLGIIKLGYGAIRSGAIPIEIGDEAMYGENNDIKVVEIIDPSGKLHILHSKLMVALENLGCIYINQNPKWTYENYSPHVTIKNNNKLDRPFICSSLTLNKKDDDKNKIIINTVDIF